MLVELRNDKHKAKVRFQVKESGERISASRMRRINRVLCPDGCCDEMPLRESGPQHATRRGFLIVSDMNGGMEVYARSPDAIEELASGKEQTPPERSPFRNLATKRRGELRHA